MSGMSKRNYAREDDGGDDGYVEVECPQCEAPMRTKFQRGRHTRRLRCPVCQDIVTLSRPPAQANRELADLIQIQVKSKRSE